MLAHLELNSPKISNNLPAPHFLTPVLQDDFLLCILLLLLFRSSVFPTTFLDSSPSKQLLHLPPMCPYCI